MLTRTMAAAVALLLVVVVPAQDAMAGAQPITECPTVISEPGRYKVTQDLLACPGTPFGQYGGAILIESSDVRLNLRGHTISCDTNETDFDYATGIVVTPGQSNVRITNGTISGCNDGILVVGVSDSIISRMTITGSVNKFLWNAWGHAIQVYSSSNIKVRNNNLSGNEVRGIIDSGGVGNSISRNTASWNGTNAAPGSVTHGILVEESQDARITCNIADSNGELAIGIALNGVSSTDALIRGNVTRNNTAGIVLFGFPPSDIPAGNTIRHNLSYGNVFDLSENTIVDGNIGVEPGAPCRNVWKNNEFVTELGPLDCIGTPVMLDEDDICALDDCDDDDDDD